MAPRAGLEPATNGLTVRRSTTELPGNTRWAQLKGRDFAERGAGCQGKRALDGRSRLWPQKRAASQAQWDESVSAHHLLALRRLTPTTMRSTRQVLVASCRAAD